MILQFPVDAVAAQPRAGDVCPEHMLTESEWRSVCAEEIAQGYELCGFRSRELAEGEPAWAWYHEAVLRQMNGRKVRFAFVTLWGPRPRDVLTNLTRADLFRWAEDWILREGTVLVEYLARKAGGAS